MTKKLLLSTALCATLAGASMVVAGNTDTTYATPRAADDWYSMPESGETVDEFPESIIIAFYDFAAEDYGDATPTYTFNGAPVNMTPNPSRDGSSFNLVVTRGYDAPTGNGTLDVHFPEGVFLDADGNPSPEISYVLYIGDGNAEPTVTVSMNPQNGATLTEAPTFYYITFNGATTVTNDDTLPTASWNGNDISSTVIGDCDGNVFSVRFYEMEAHEEVITGNGELVIEFPAGYFIVDDQPWNEVINYNVTINSAISEISGFFDYVVEGYPAINKFLPAKGGITDLTVMTSEALTLNTECTEEVELYRNSEKISSIAATNDKMVVAYEEYVSFYFTEDEEEEITAEGYYSIVVPEGFFMTEDGLKLPASTAYLQKGIGIFTPENGGEVDLLNPDGNIVNSKNAMYAIGIKSFTSPYLSLNERRLDDEGNEVISEGCKEPAVLTDSEGNTVASFDVNLQFIQQGTLWFKFTNTPITKNGEYKLTLPKGYLFATFGKEQVETPAYELTFTVTGGAEGPDQIYTLTPENKSCQVFPTITMTYEDVKEITLTDPEAKVYMNLSTETNVLAFTVTAENNVVTLTPDDPEFNKYLNAYAVYTVIIPAGFMNLEFNNGETYPNRLVEISDYKINPCPLPTLDPAPGMVSAEDLENIVFHLNGATNTSMIMKAMWLYSVKDGVRDEQIYKYKGTFADKTTLDATMTLTISTNNIEGDLPDGEYELVIPASTYSAKPDGATTYFQCPDMSFFYTVGTDTSVKGLEAADETVTVFTMTGIKVLDNAEKEALSTLPAGLYIVNGKKIVIR